MKRSGNRLLAALLMLLMLLQAGCSTGETGEQTPDAPPVTNNTEDVSVPEDKPPEGQDTGMDTEDRIDIRAQEILAGMTVEQKIGQMMLVPCPRTASAEIMKEYQFGGYVLYTDNFKDSDGKWLTEEQLEHELETIRAEARLAPLFAVDEEGGTVTRLSANPNFFPQGKLESPQKIWKEKGVDALREITENANSVLKGSGINVNLAPVADVVTERGAFMYSRSMGADAETTAELVRTVVSAIEKSGVGAVMKHFPGYGNNADTHRGSAVDERPHEQFTDEDFLPFAAGIEAGANAVMMSHNIVTCMDPERPASLSPEVHRVLREELGFDGVIMTDDLIMAAVEVGRGESKAVLAVLAGNDLLLTGSYHAEFRQIKEAVESGEITEARLDESVLRILKWKLKLGVME